MKVVLIDYGAGNTKSVQYALKRLGVEAVLTNNPELIQKADKVIFPGVGHANSAMEKLEQSGLNKLIPNLKQPFLGICLGMQLMCKYSEEGATKGLGIFDLNVLKFGNDNKIPQIGWNTIVDLNSEIFHGLNENEYMYFVHSYYVPIASETIAKAKYGVIYSAALKKNNFYGCQFHPEKSGDKGELILKNFLAL
jgi:glutamine amidotransferase